ncbi:MAG: permease [bacterium]|nr:permease [bacterium]
MNRPYSNQGDAVAAEAVYAGETVVGDRSRFLLRVYGHLLAAIAAFVVLEVWFFQSGLAWRLTEVLLGVNWGLVLGGFLVVSWLARGLAARTESRAVQYGGLGLFVVAEAIIFAPMLYLANHYAPGVIGTAAQITAVGFVGLTLIVLQTRKDFSFLGGMLRWAGILALVAIGGGLVFGWHLGMWFSVAMIGLAGAAILHDTSKILYHWPSDRYVGAALELFASVALMFWYVLRLLMSRR